MDNLKWLLIGVLVMLGIYLIVQSQQGGYDTQAGRIFPKETAGITKLVVEKGGEMLTLTKTDTTWSIVGHDTLVVKADRISALFGQAFDVERETLMTQKTGNWGKYSVDDATGTHVKIFDAADVLVTHVVFGQSTSDWSRNYVRVGEGSGVFLTNTSVLNLFSTGATYWGQKPPAPKFEPVVLDSVGVTQ
jgi:hypothetical protein